MAKRIKLDENATSYKTADFVLVVPKNRAQPPRFDSLDGGYCGPIGRTHAALTLKATRRGELSPLSRVDFSA